MMRKTYTLRPAQIWAYALATSLLLVLLVMVPIMILTPFISSADSDIIIPSLIAVAVSSVIIVIVGIPFFYQHFKKTQLIIDHKGIKVSSKVLSIIPNLAPIGFEKSVQLYRVENCAKTMLGTMAKIDPTLRKNDVALVLINQGKQTQYTRKMFIISDNIWQIDDIDELQHILEQSGLNINRLDAKEFINQYLPQLADLGRKAGIAAYSSIAFALISMTIFYIDKYSTIFYGSFKNVLWLSLIVSGILSFLMIRGNIKQLPTHIFVSLLFAMTFTLMFLSISLISVPFFGSQNTYDFQFEELNEYNEEKWISIQNSDLEIYCKKSEDSKILRPEIQTTKVYKLFGVMRVNGKDLCPHSKFLSDGLLPHK